MSLFITNKNTNLFSKNISIDILSTLLTSNNFKLILSSEFESIIIIRWRKTNPHVSVNPHTDKNYFNIFLSVEIWRNKITLLEDIVKVTSCDFFFFIFALALAVMQTSGKLSDSNYWKSFMNLDLKNFCTFITFSYL